ncbi:PAAR domain-containing protein [Alphaproteobacteria bacterium KMM 3653]|uniref:PAAR domain-containing protein n=2 Tax=Harenicola maris TaxID=2841044 RepID=A0AAP2G4B4_9RHOB|nr:PAAR domain-containing protein [Harenicola maris]
MRGLKGPAHAPILLASLVIFTPRETHLMVPVARMGDKHACPLCKVVTPIVGGSAVHTCDGKPVARVGDKTGCGATIIKGSSQSTADGKPVAYMGAQTSHGGTIITGSPQSKVMP